MEIKNEGTPSNDHLTREGVRKNWHDPEDLSGKRLDTKDVEQTTI